jgi:putative colanic acid biosynthesis acetyltransferase WcaF
MVTRSDGSIHRTYMRFVTMLRSKPKEASSKSDPFLNTPFAFREKLRRLLWQICWATLCKISPVPWHGWRCGILKFFGGRIGPSNFIYPTARIWAPWLLRTGDVVTIGPDAEIYNAGGVELGHHSIISQGAYLCGATHDYNSPEFTYVSKPIRTAPYVWICARAIVLPGIECGEGSVLGAGSVATRSMEEWTVYAGNPATPVRKRTRVNTDDSLN